MKIVVTGSLGNIGKPLVTELAEKGHAVTVISSRAERQNDIEALGATAAICSLQNVDFLSSTLTGADAVFTMVPPNFTVPNSRAYYQSISNSYAQAIQKSGIKRVVNLSSWGAHLDKGTGFIIGSHDVENMLNNLPGIEITHLRAGFIHYNLYNFSGMIKSAGFIGANYGGNDRIIMVAPADIAAAAAEELTQPAAGVNVRYVASDEHTANEAAQILGAAIGKPDLQWRTFTDEQARSGMKQQGLPEDIVANSIELGAAIHSGVMLQDYDLHKPPAIGKLKLEDFAKEFAAKFDRTTDHGNKHD